jgi:hypothetical protein
MAEIAASTGHALLPYILNFQWTYKIHASLRHRLITVTFMTQRLHRLRSHALLLRSLSLSRLRSLGILVMVLGLKSTNHNRLRSPGIHVTYSQTLFLMSLYYLLLSSSQTLKQSPLNLNARAHSIIPRTQSVHVIRVSRSKQPSFLRYHGPKLRRH